MISVAQCCLNTLAIVSDHVHLFMTTVDPSSDGQQDNVPWHKTLKHLILVSLSSLCPNVLHDYQIPVQQSTFGIW